MIKLDIQMFAKTVSQMQQYRKSKAVSKFAKESETKAEKKEEEKSSASKKQTLGEAVSAVSTRDTYEIYRIDHGTETLVTRNGSVALRTGAQILEKMTFNKRLGVWVSKDKGFKYRVRKKR